MLRRLHKRSLSFDGGSTNLGLRREVLVPVNSRTVVLVIVVEARGSRRVAILLQGRCCSMLSEVMHSNTYVSQSLVDFVIGYCEVLESDASF